MTGRDLLEALSRIDERFIDEAENGRLLRFPWRWAASIAACVCLVLLSLWGIGPQTGPGPETTDPYLVPEGYPTVTVYVEEMTDDGFDGTITENIGAVVYGIDLEIGMEVHVTVTGEISCDYTGQYVLVEFSEYDPASGSVTATFTEAVPPPE